MSRDIDGRYRLKDTYITDIRECVFIDHVLEEVEGFLLKNNLESRVLVLPHLSPRYRFLLHNLAANHFGGTLTTVSVGEGSDRQTFLYSVQFMEGIKETKQYERQDVLKDNDAESSAKSTQKTKSKRPSKKLYQPPSASTVESKPSPVQTSATSPSKSSAATASSSNDIDDDWDSLYDDSGECVKPELVKDFKKLMKLDEEDDETSRNCSKPIINFEATSQSFNDFIGDSSGSITDHEYGHVLEIFDFPADLKTPDLYTRIAAIGSNTFEIVWVDDTHALVVFESEKCAVTALRHGFLDLKVRVLSQATKESRLKARRSTDRLLPFKKRPQTSTETARRLVGRHLGLKVEVSRDQRLAEKKALQEAKEQRRQSKKQTNDVWDGNVD